MSVNLFPRSCRRTTYRRILIAKHLLRLTSFVSSLPIEEPNTIMNFLRVVGLTAPPRQIVSPYKPSEDLEQMPLINPNSPSHLSGAVSSPYTLLGSSRDGKHDRDEVDLAYGESRTKSLKKTSHKSNCEPTTSKSILNKVKCATLGRSHKSEAGSSKTDEVHEYHEISDTDTESNAADNVRSEHFVLPESPGIPKSYGDFSQSLFDEMESMFRSLDGRRRDDPGAPGKHFDIESAIRSHTLSKMDKKKGFQTNTMKPMSAHDERTLDTAVAMANEITTKSMNDLDGDSRLPSSPGDRSKFHFKFPQLHLHHNQPNEMEREALGKHAERRNFSDEANSVPDIQSTITEESKMAYASLIEGPTPAPSLLADSRHKPATIPKPAPRDSRPQFHSLQKPIGTRSSSTEENEQVATSGVNKLPLPPRSTKPKLVDKPRHIRKHPLKLLTIPSPPQSTLSIIYQNALTPIQPKSVDVCDDAEKIDTNPFNSNPFNCYMDDDCAGIDFNAGSEENRGLVKDCSDHVSVEDLLEFADQKPCGRQRGVESDEVRIMSKVLKQQVTSEQCLEALELSDWNVHLAIKVVRVRDSVAHVASLAESAAELGRAAGDVSKAATALSNKYTQN